jgi:nucleoside 2-deoxyribosyltransferase
MTTPFSVYVAGAAVPEELERIRKATAALRLAGFVVTSTWPETVAKVGNANPRDADHLQRRQWSVQDLAEIDAAHAVWFLVPTPPVTTRGAWLECGYAYAEDKHLLFSGDTKQSIFAALGIEYETDADAFWYLHRLRVEAGLTELRQSAPTADEWPNLSELGGEG